MSRIPHMHPARGLLALATALLLIGACAPAGGGGDDGGDSGGTHANRVISYDPVNSTGATPDEWPYFFNPGAALGEWMGVLDVVSLGYDKNASDTFGGNIVLGLGSSTDSGDNACIRDGTGDDFIVYENAFATTTMIDNEVVTGTNSEVVLVAVSQNGNNWYPFPTNQNTALPLIDPERYTGYAGVSTSQSGGDRFDLATVIAAESALDNTFQACYVRLTDGGTAHMDYGNTQSDMYASGADIDAVTVIHPAAAPGLSP
jgi:hypothetical protein